MYKIKKYTYNKTPRAAERQSARHNVADWGEPAWLGGQGRHVPHTVGPEASVGGPIGLLKNGDIIHIDAKKGTINVDLSKKELSKRKKRWKPKKINFGNGTLWKYAQTVGPAYLGASTHPGGKKEVKCYADI